MPLSSTTATLGVARDTYSGQFSVLTTPPPYSRRPPYLAVALCTDILEIGGGSCTEAQVRPRLLQGHRRAGRGLRPDRAQQRRYTEFYVKAGVHVVVPFECGPR